MNSLLLATKPSPCLNPPPDLTRTEGLRTQCLFSLRFCLGLCLVLLCHPEALPQDGAAGARLITSEIVQRLVAENEQRSRELGAYTARRHYHVAYVGFPHPAEADMIVDAVCNGANSKHFDVVSESGSHLLLDHVLKKLLKTEQRDAAHRADSALTPENYTFSLVGAEQEEGRLLYVLTVEPILSGALLYRGRIWVGAQNWQSDCCHDERDQALCGP
jgi:hypothetical protein